MKLRKWHDFLWFSYSIVTIVIGRCEQVAAIEAAHGT
jgi:hypothetical protein